MKNSTSLLILAFGFCASCNTYQSGAQTSDTTATTATSTTDTTSTTTGTADTTDTTDTDTTTSTSGVVPDVGQETDGSTTEEPFCGDGHLDPGEECDDGNDVDEDACPTTCEGCLLSLRVFVSSDKYDGHLSGVGGADLLCQGLAMKAGLPGLYRAWISGSSHPAGILNTDFKGQYIRTDGAVVAVGWEDLTDGVLEHPIVKDEKGALVDDEMVWTNTTPEGTSAGSYNCMGWTSNDKTLGGTVGFSTYVNSNWTETMVAQSCATSHRIYCIQNG